MRNTTIYMLGGLAALAFSTVIGYMTGGLMAAMGGMFGGIIGFIIIVQLIMTARSKGFLPLYWNLEEENGIKKEMYGLLPNKFGRLQLIVTKIVGDGVLFAKRLGIIDHKGTEYAFGNSPLCFIQPKSGFTQNIKSAQYHNLLKKKLGIDCYEDAVKQYLGPNKYKEFRARFRTNPEPDADDIKLELQWLRDQKAENMLSLFVFGETYTWDNDLAYMQWNYLPQTMNNFVTNEKINVRREEMGYKDKSDKAKSYALAVVLVIIGIVILLAVMSSLDLSKIGALFGGK